RHDDEELFIMTVDLKNLLIDDVLARLGKAEQHVSVLSSSSPEGWEPTVAWNPIDTFEVMYNETTDPTARLEEFISRQQQAGRLVIGHTSYDFGCMLHNVKLSTEDDLKTPLLYVLSFDNWITFDGDKSVVHAKDAEFNEELTRV